MRSLQENFTAIYRKNTPDSLIEILTNMFPLLQTALGSQNWKKQVDDFFQNHPIKTPIVHEIPDEFVDYLYHHAEKKHFELAHYEWVEIALYFDKTDLAQIPCHSTGDLLQGIPVVSPLAYLLHYETLKQHAEDYYIAYRNTKHDVFYLGINLFSAKFFELLQKNTSLSGESVLKTLAIDTHHPSPALVLENGLALLQEWREKDIILGIAC